MTLLANVVATSQRVSATPARLAKVRELAACLRALEPEEIEIGVQYLSGETPQGRFGLGYATLQAASVRRRPRPSPSFVDLAKSTAASPSIASIRGSGLGSPPLRSAARAVHTRNGRRTGIPHPPARRRAAPGRAGRCDGRCHRLRGRIARRAGTSRRDVRRRVSVPWRASRCSKAAQALGAISARAASRPSRRCLRRPPRMSRRLWQQLGGEVAFEWKMDGARIQVHKSAETVRIYTRTPERGHRGGAGNRRGRARVARARSRSSMAKPSLSTRSGRPHPFQITMRRFGRKLDVEALRARVAHARVLLRLPAPRRAESLPTARRANASHALAQAVPGRCEFRGSSRLSEPQARAFYEAALAAGHEGVMAKSLDSPYEAGKPRRELAQDQAGAHARPGGARRRVGPWPAHRQAFESASRRARSRRPANTSCSARPSKG